MSQEAPRPVAYVLVESGLHAGARLELTEANTWYSAGGSTASEYWLADPDLAEAKVEFAVVNDTILVRLLSGPQLVIGTVTLEEGSEAAFDQQLLWGGVSMRAVALPPAPKPDVSVAPEPPVTARDAVAQALIRVRAFMAARTGASNKRLASIVLAVVAIVVPTGMALSLMSSMLERHNRHESRREALSAQDDPLARLARASSAAQRLNDLIGLPSVTTTALDHRTLAVTGVSVPVERMDSIRVAIAQFEADFTVRDHIAYRSAATSRPVQLTQMPAGVDLILYGPDGYLRGQDGTLYLPGGQLPDGMQVEVIREGEVWLSRGTDRAVVRASRVEN